MMDITVLSKIIYILPQGSNQGEKAGSASCPQSEFGEKLI
jgi:hypothetical protein